MKSSELLNATLSIDEAVELIKQNKEHGYIWLAVKGKNGCLFELGGRNRDGLQLKAYIPKFEDGNYVIPENGFTCSEYAITQWSVEFPSKNCLLPKNFDLIKFLKKTDFREYYPTFKSRTYVKDYVTEYTLIK